MRLDIANDPLAENAVRLHEGKTASANRWRSRKPPNRSSFAHSESNPASWVDGKLARWQHLYMKTTLDLPDHLVQRLKIRAVQERRPLKHLVADLLTQALAKPLSSPANVLSELPDGIELNAQGIPVVRCGPNASAPRMTAAELVALEHKILEEEDLRRAGIAL